MSGTDALERDTRRDPEQPASSQQTWTLYCTHVQGSELNELSPSPQSCEARKQHHIHCMNEELAREV